MPAWGASGEIPLALALLLWECQAGRGGFARQQLTDVPARRGRTDAGAPLPPPNLAGQGATARPAAAHHLWPAGPFRSADGAHPDTIIADPLRCRRLPMAPVCNRGRHSCRCPRPTPNTCTASSKPHVRVPCMIGLFPGHAHRLLNSRVPVIPFRGPRYLAGDGSRLALEALATFLMPVADQFPGRILLIGICPMAYAFPIRATTHTRSCRADLIALKWVPSQLLAGLPLVPAHDPGTAAAQVPWPPSARGATPGTPHKGIPSTEILPIVDCRSCTRARLPAVQWARDRGRAAGAPSELTSRVKEPHMPGSPKQHGAPAGVRPLASRSIATISPLLDGPGSAGAPDGPVSGHCGAAELHPAGGCAGADRNIRRLASLVGAPGSGIGGPVEVITLTCRSSAPRPQVPANAEGMRWGPAHYRGGCALGGHA